MKKGIINLIIVFLITTNLAQAQRSKHPNILFIITDDQGYGDFGFTGNRYVKTPVLDKLAKESVKFNNFYASPLCAPTRASLMTGRYSLRTAVRDTYNGGAIMSPDEITLAEMLKQANYKTGLFGKWHLGDNYPSRPMDQGFDEAVMHLGGGMGQAGDITTYFKKDSSYYNPVLWHNGKQQAYQGYCTDVFAEQAMRFIKENKERPFFCYLAFNAPHTPLQVPDKYYQQYKNIDPSAGYEKDGRPFPKMSENDKEDARRVYAMVSSIDENIGKVLRSLDELKIADNTIIIFMTDNGPEQYRYVAGMRGKKTSVYRGGVRVPFLVKYPAFKTKEVDAVAAHIDVLPTIAEICQVDLPKNTKLDGKSFLPLLNNKNAEWPERSLFFYWTRRYPERYSNMAFQQGNYKLVGNTSYDAAVSDFELYDISKDPYEQKNIISEKMPVAENLKTRLDKMYDELISSKHLVGPQYIEVGSRHENPIILNRNDADGERGLWGQEKIYGKWHVKVQPGRYNIKFKFINPVPAGGNMLLETNRIVNKKSVKTSTDLIEMKNVYLPAMQGELIPTYMLNKDKTLPLWVELEKVD